VRMEWKVQVALVIGALCLAPACNAQDVRLAKELTFNNEVFATRPNDALTYVVIGGGWLRGIRSEDPVKFISAWLAKHPAATVKPISRMVFPRGKDKGEQIEYIWIEDGEASLNVDLVRAGIYPAPAMADMVDFRKQLDEILKQRSIVAEIAKLDKQHPEMPQALSLLKPERLISDEDYKQRVQRTEAAANIARKEKPGVWSDSMKEERESLGGQ
jgi:hypothetical protein